MMRLKQNISILITSNMNMKLFIIIENNLFIFVN